MKPTAIIIDLDGTIAHNVTDRGWFDETRMHEDALDEVIHEVVCGAVNFGHVSIIVSGRSEASRTQTLAWLDFHGVPYDIVILKPDEMGHESDTDVEYKARVYREQIEPKYDVRYAIEDRNSIVKMWREEFGLKVLHVADVEY
jgi:hypothetical protein